MQLDLAAGAPLRGIDHAGIDMLRIQVQTGGALLELAQIEGVTHGFGGIPASARTDGALPIIF